MSEQIIMALVASVVAIIGALTTFITSRLKSKALTSEIDAIKKAIAESDKLYFIECPNCNTKIYLSQVKIKTESKEE